MPALRSYVARHFSLELEDPDGGPTQCGFLRSVDGGGVKAEVVSQQVGGMAVRAKHIALPQPDAFNISVGMSMSKTFWKWIKDSWDGKISRRNGAVQTLDRDLNVMHDQSFLQALVTETVIPALDGSAKEAGYLNVKFMPESTRHKKSSGKASATFHTEQKLWSPQNFRLEIEGINCTKVAKIESFTIKQNVKRLEIGGAREFELEPVGLEFPNLSVTFAMVTADSWFAWHEDFVINGNNDTSKEKQGSITFLSPNRGRELLTINLKQIGISSLTPDKGDSNTDSIRRVKADLYVEEMDLLYK